MGREEICVPKKNTYVFLFVLVLGIFFLFTSFISRSKPSTQTRAAEPYRNAPIIGGGTPNPGEFPYMVFIYYKDKLIYDPGTGRYDLYTNKPLICGGTVIASHWIITAAHCIRDVTSYANIGVAVGVANLQGSMDKTTYDKTFYSVQEVKIQPNYEYVTDPASADIALMRTTTDMNINSALFPLIPSPTLDGILYSPGNVTKIAGYGVSGYDTWFFIFNFPVFPKALNTIDLPIMKSKKDILVVGYADENIMNTHTASNHDSGGPIITIYRGSPYLIGVVSDNFNGVASPRISQYADWIHQTIDK